MRKSESEREKGKKEREGGRERIEYYLLVLQLHNTLHSAVVVEEIYGAYHLHTLRVVDAQLESSNGVATGQLDKLSCRRELGVNSNGRQLENLEEKET